MTVGRRAQPARTARDLAVPALADRAGERYAVTSIAKYAIVLVGGVLGVQRDRDRLVERASGWSLRWASGSASASRRSSRTSSPD
jgi:hypothetical protein